MDNRHEIREFLGTRRAKLSPEQTGLPTFGGTRRVPGLRREEIAQLAGVSVEYYTKLERGSLNGVSESVLESLARALQLDEAEREHLHNLARAASPSARPRRKPSQAVSPSVQRLLDSMVGVPAFIRNGRLDVLAINASGAPCTPRRTAGPPGNRRTWPGSRSSTSAPTSSTRTGRRRPTPPSRSSTPRPAGTRSTSPSPT